MWSDLVVAGAPGLDYLPGIFQTRKPIQVETVVSELAFVAFLESILSWLTRLDEMQLRPILSDPAVPPLLNRRRNTG